MSVDPLPALALPAHPNLEQQKKRARELLNAARANDPDALSRFASAHKRMAGRPHAAIGATNLSLHDAQVVIAREYGFSSWAKLRAHIDALTVARRTHPFVRDVKYYGATLDVSAHGDRGTPAGRRTILGHREVSDLLAEHGIVPNNLRVAAGLGRLDLIEACFDASDALTALARARRDFYRLHSGFPVWQPSDDERRAVYAGSPQGWAEFAGARETRDYLARLLRRHDA